MQSNVLDSRSIGLGDAFGQRFMKEGTFYYDIAAAGTGRVVHDHPHEIVVKGSPSDHQMEQHTVLVSQRDSTPRPDRARLEIRAGDLVVWTSVDRDISRFEIIGQKEFFGSSSLVNECGYSHRFVRSGTYEWRDAHGGKARGVVRVNDPKVGDAAALERWKKKLANAKLVMINDGKVEPAQVTVEMGQTVYFAVVKGKGISVTDVDLLRAGGFDDDQRPGAGDRVQATKGVAKKKAATKSRSKKQK